jgi:hypothetical protein
MTDTIDGEAEIRELEVRLRRLAEELLARSQVAGGDALELMARGVSLQRAAFLLHREVAIDELDLREP